LILFLERMLHTPFSSMVKAFWKKCFDGSFAHLLRSFFEQFKKA
jgi:hypothetical protein